MGGDYTTTSADFNRDGNVDILYCGNPVTVLFRGNGSGGFTAGSNAVGGVSSAVAVAQLNNDNVLDLIFATGAANVRVALGRGDGTFSNAVTYAASTGAGFVGWVGTADFDGDLHEDIAACGPALGLSTFINRGDGTFNAFRNVPLAMTAWGGIATGDFNQDSFPDIVCVSNSNTIATFLNRGNGTFATSTNSPLPGIPYLGGIRAADLDGDGILDLVGRGQTECVALHGNGDGTFEVLQRVSTTATSLYGFRLGDFNGDGRLDIAINANTSFAIAEGLGDGHFAALVYFQLPLSVNIASGDFNKDQRPDLAFWHGGTTTVIDLVSNETVFLPPLPELTWAKFGANTRLVWYTNYPGFRLEFRPTLDAAVQWAQVTASPLQIDCQNFYTISTNPPGFYRLRQVP
jgi:hypothetical protein